MGKNCDLPLHGFTVVVETTGPYVYIGRYHSENADELLLMDADAREIPEPAERAAHVAKSARYGVFKNADQVRVPKALVSSVRRLVEYLPSR
jgi:hypothetical protein